MEDEDDNDDDVRADDGVADADAGGANAAGEDANADIAASDGLPGAPVPGHPGLRAGVFGQGGGALGLYRTTDGQAADGVGGPAGLQTVSWRDTDPQANTYDLYTAKRDLGEAQTIGNVLGLGGWGQLGASIGAKRAPQLGLAGIAKSLGALADPEVGALGGALGTYMDKVEVPRLQNKINTLQARQKQFARGSGSGAL